MDAVAWIKWAVAIVSEYWKALAGTGVTSAGLVVLAWVHSGAYYATGTEPN